MKPICCLVVVAACLFALPAAAAQGEKDMTFTIMSPAFEPGSRIPKDFTADGSDLSPALAWANPPSGCQAFALICDDPDAPAGTWVHWLIWNLPGSAQGIPQGAPTQKTLADGSAQGRNDFGRIGYGGPSPPRGKLHRYFFRLYALKEKLPLAAGASRRDLEKAMQGKILGTAELFGTYER
jgi:Raf kinase inhibitor-like YbhB/YbcL family protein